MEQTGADAHAGFGAEPNRSFGLAMADVRPGRSKLHLPLHCASKWTHVIAPASLPEERTIGRRGFARTTTPTPTAHSFSIPMATISRLSVTSRSEGFWFCWT